MKAKLKSEMQLNMIPQESNRDERFSVLKDRIKICFYVGLIYFIFNLIDIGCPIRYFTGISCPGCGMTRAVLAALRLDFNAAFYYHPLFLITPFMLFLFLFEAYIKPIHCKIAWALIISLFLIVYIIRLFFLKNGVVNIDIWNGIVLKLIHQISVGGFR